MKNEYQLGYQSPYACTVCKKYTIVSYRNTANAIITKKNNNSQFLGNVYTVKIIPSVLLTHAPYSYCKKILSIQKCHCSPVSTKNDQFLPRDAMHPRY